MKYQLALRSLSFLFLLSSCNSNPVPTRTEAVAVATAVERGDLVVTSFTNDSVVLFDPEGNFKKVLYQIPTALDSIGGMAWLEDTSEILLSIEGTPDRIEAISAVTGLVRTFYNNSTFFTGTTLAVAQLRNSGDVIVSEGATIERFSNRGIRESYGAIWPTSVHANSSQLVSLSTGNWLSCSSTAGLRVLPDSTTALAMISTATGPVGATATFGCGELSNGKIAVAWKGAAADHIYLYSPTLTGGTSIHSTVPSILVDPRGMAVGENDEIYVTDGTRNVVVEFDQLGNHVREFGNAFLQSPRNVLAIPAFTP